MAFNRELSQFASYLALDAAANYIGITSGESSTNVGIGKTNPTSKLDVVGSGQFTGIVTAASGFVGGLTGDVTGNINSTGISTFSKIFVSNIDVSGIVTAASGFVGGLTGNVTGNINSTGISTFATVSAANINASGIVTATSGFVGALTGNADTASALQNSRTIALTGDVVGEVSFDGSANVSIAATIQPNSVSLGDDTTGNYVATISDAGSSDIVVGGSGTETAGVTLGLSTTGVTAGSYGSASAIPTFTVDSRGRLTAAGTVNVSTGMTVSGDSGSETIDLLTETLTVSGGTNLTSSAANNTVTINLDNDISLTSVNASGIVTAAEFKTGSIGEAIGINTNTISGPATITLDPAAVGDDTGKVVIKGDLQVDGTTTTINSTTVTIDDKNIQIADGAANDAAADGAGFTVISGDGNKTFQFNDATDAFKSSISLEVASSQVYKVDGNKVLSATTLGSGVTNSSLTNVGTLTNLNVAGVTTSTGGFVGALTGNADTATTLQTARDFSISGDATASAISFNGSNNVGLALTLANTGVTTGTYGSASEIPTFTVDAKGRLTSAGSVSVSTGMTVSGDSGTETINLLTETLTVSGGTNLTSSAANNTVTINLDNDISLTSVNASGIVTATGGFVGGLTGNVTGNINSSGISTFATVSAANINASGIITATSGFVGALTGNVTGDVTGNVTGNLTGGVTGDVTGNINSTGISTFATASISNLNVSGIATLSGVSLANINASGIVTATGGFVGGITGDVTGNINSTGISTFATVSAANISASGIVTATGGFVGGITGDVTGNINSTGISTFATVSAANISASGIVTATGGFVGGLTGNADTASALQSARVIEISGDVAGQVWFDGTANVSIAATIQPNSVGLGTDTTGDYVATIADSGSSDIVVSGSGSETAAVTLGLSTTGVAAGSYGSSTQIPTFTVDSRGRLTAAGTASVGTALTVSGDSGSETIDLLTETLTVSGGTNLTSSSASNTVTINLDNDISLTSVNASGIVTAAEFKTGASGSAIGINTNTISGPATITIDPAAVGDDTGKVVIKGDLQVDGTTTTINSTTVTVDDLNILLADGAVNDAAANGGGFTVQSGDGNKTFQFEASGDNFGSSENVNVASGKVYKVNNIEVLSETTLGAGVSNSSLTNVGTLTNLNVAGVTTSTGGFVGALTGNVTGNVSGNLIGVADTAVKLQTARDFSISGDATASAISFDGTANVGLALTLANTGVTTGTYGSASEIPTFTVDAKGRLTSASTVNVATALTVTSDSGTETINLLNETLTVSGGTNLNSSANNNTLTVNLDNDISLTSVNASGIVTATGGFVGGLTGNVTGNINSTGISTFATVSAANISASGIVTATSGFVGALTGNVTGDVTGNLTGGHTGDVTGNINSSGISTLTNVNLNGYLSIGSTTGVNNYIVASTGIGVTWKNVADILPQTRTTQSNIATSGQTAFNFDYNVSYLDVFVNGVRLSSSEFTATNGTSITLTEAAFAGDIVEFVSYSTVIGGAGSVNSLNDLTDVNTAGAVTGNLLNYNGSEWVVTSTLSGITSIDATTRATIETAVAAAPNDFTSLNITNSGISTFSGALDVNADADISGKLTVANISASGIVTATSGFVGALTGNVTGNVTGNLTGGHTGDVTGNINSSGISTFATVSAANINASGIVTAAQFVTGASGSAIGINTNTISGPATITIDPAAVGDNTGTVVIKGDLQVDGTTTTINSTTMTVDDLNVTLASGAANAVAANGAGITVDGANATFTYASTGDKWVSNKDVEATNFNSVSDITLKENISIIDGALEMINQLNGISWNWKDTKKASLGVSAQNVESVIPELVSNGASHKSVNYNGLIGILIEAVKEQGAQINALKEELANKANKRTRNS